MPAAPRLRDLVAMLCPGFFELGGLRFHQSNIRIAAQGTDLSFHSRRASEAGVKERHSVNTILADPKVAGLRIDATKRERLQRNMCPCLARCECCETRSPAARRCPPATIEYVRSSS